MRQTKYQRIAEELRAELASMDAGAQLPSEKELASRYGVSPMTIRQALERLQDAGLVTRVLGRGTYVQRRVIAKGDELTSFSEDMRMRGLEPSTRLLGIDLVPAGDDVARDLRTGRSERVLQLERLRLADGEPICLELAHVPERLSRAVMDAPGASLHELLAEQNAAPHSATRRIRATSATDRQASLLGLPPASPLLHIVQVFFDERGRPVQRADSVYRADRYEAYSRVRRSDR